MRSRIAVQVDFENNNRPVIEVNERDSDDTRDRLISALFEKLGHHSRWFRVEFKHNTITDGDQGSLWHLIPISPDEYEMEIRLMIAHGHGVPQNPGAEPPTGVPRRAVLNMNCPAELAIFHAMQEVEKMPPDTRLTDAVILLQKAKDKVADFIDDKK